MPPNRSASKRRRKSATGPRVLHAADAETDKRKAPRLGKRTDGDNWHPRVKAWWADLWSSAAVLDLDQSDRFAAWLLADIYHRQATARSNAEVVRMSAEARGLAASLGLSVRSRHLAKVEISNAERAEDKRLARRNRRITEVDTAPRPTDIDPSTLTTEEMLALIRPTGTETS